MEAAEGPDLGGGVRSGWRDRALRYGPLCTYGGQRAQLTDGRACSEPPEPLLLEGLHGSRTGETSLKEMKLVPTGRPSSLTCRAKGAGTSSALWAHPSPTQSVGLGLPWYPDLPLSLPPYSFSSTRFQNSED